MTSSKPLQLLVEEYTHQFTEELIRLRRDFHQHPELSNREYRTSRIVASYLEELGLNVTRDIAHTGVVALLEGKEKGPVIALRADMDALPVSEKHSSLSFASQVSCEYEGKQVDVMHACGHDCHTAILLVVAKILSQLKEHWRGSIKLIFQPAEEGAPEGETGGAELMIAEGVLENPRPSAIFGLHVIAGMKSGHIGYRSGPTMASSDTLKITIHGSQTHGAMPWLGIDPIVVASQVILGLQTITSRQLDVTHEPAIITIACIQGGIRDNIIPDQVKLLGTIRTFDERMRSDVAQRVHNTVTHIASSAGATAEVTIERGYSVTVNDPHLTQDMVGSLTKAAGIDKVFVSPKLTGAEDFSKYQEKIPGLFFFLGITPEALSHGQAAPNHSPHFTVDEGALPVGVKALCFLALDGLALLSEKQPG